MDDVKRGNSLAGAPGECGWTMMRGNSLGGSSAAGGSETGAPDQRGWIVKRGSSLGGAPLEGARRERRTSVDGL